MVARPRSGPTVFASIAVCLDADDTKTYYQPSPAARYAFFSCICCGQARQLALVMPTSLSHGSTDPGPLSQSHSDTHEVRQAEEIVWPRASPNVLAVSSAETI